MKYKITWQTGQITVVEGSSFDDALRNSGRDPHDIAGMNYYNQLPVKYKCFNCGWIGTEDEMDCDSYWIDSPKDPDDIFCNTICPKCHGWYPLEDYEEIKE